MARRRIVFTVLGQPETKGSAKAIVPKKWADDAHRAGTVPRAIVTNDNPSAAAWEQRIATEAQTVASDGLFVGPVIIAVTFWLPRPKSLPKYVRHHLTRPDCDKAARCVLDALSGVLYHDDKQVVALHVRKLFAAPAAPTGARIVVEEAEEPDPQQLDFINDNSLFA